ncbi:hypothetical protein JRO89_XS02G0027600 [Xanthoceras sorbifolium]|uniref:NADH dehydrogenase [ubiquinone] 1 beta subcomplex subunit 9 n=1 Tax=Xanthoceras sorbifolium TaxID=99658 RepID=A0ABQ8IE90_9ROSI|nr:hypothetical protein JRO89_XS02G0027600 [Xanthoceras sorbifolium]
MSSAVSTTAYLARRAAQKERVRILYRRALKDTLNWAVHRTSSTEMYVDCCRRCLPSQIISFPITDSDVYCSRFVFLQADELREKFDANKHVADLDTIDRLIDNAEATYNKWRHPDPYIVPWAPGGSKFCRNPTPPDGIDIVYNYGKEDND